MEEMKRILVVSRDSKHCGKAVGYGVSLAKKYGAELYVLHVVHDPFSLDGWNLSIPSLAEDYKKLLSNTRAQLTKTIEAETQQGLKVTQWIKEGEPIAEILRVVKEQHIDLMILLAHEEGRIEHFLFGRSNDELVRKMPCSLLMVKKGLGHAKAA